MHLWKHRSARIGLTACAAATGYQHNRTWCFADDAAEHVFSRAQIAEHDSEAKGIWITYRGGVYDVTRFIRYHPGGIARIMQAAGGDAKGFFDHWSVHKQPLAQSVLAKYRIGRLRDEDMQDESRDDDPYSKEPERSPGLRGLWASVSDNKPYIAEPRILPHTFETPNELFYVRNHAPVPEPVDPIESHTIDLYWEDEHLSEWTLADLSKKFGMIELHATLQCSGNRLGEMFSNLAPGSAAHAAWRGRTDVAGYAVSNALWAGVPLTRLLRDADSGRGGAVCHDLSEVEYVEFHGEDDYFIAVPLDMALAEEQEALLATHMNGERLPRDHGAPVRLLLPGCVGCRSVKWLNKIVLRRDPGDSPWVQYFYRKGGQPIWHWPIASMITAVQGLPGPELSVGLPLSAKREVAVGPDGLHIAGFAYVGGGHRVDKVEVSADGGASWLEARICDNVVRPNGKQWAWTLWDMQLPVPEYLQDGSALTISCRAWDSEGRTQPDTPALSLKATPSGYLYNPVHHVSATVYLKGNPRYIAPTEKPSG